MDVYSGAVFFVSSEVSTEYPMKFFLAVSLSEAKEIDYGITNYQYTR